MGTRSVNSDDPKGNRHSESCCQVNPIIGNQEGILQNDKYMASCALINYWQRWQKLNHLLDLLCFTYSQPKFSSLSYCSKVTNIHSFYISFQVDIFRFKLVKVFLNLKSKLWQNIIPITKIRGIMQQDLIQIKCFLNTGKKYAWFPILLYFTKKENKNQTVLKP